MLNPTSPAFYGPVQSAWSVGWFSGLRSGIVAPGTSLPGDFQPAASLPSDMPSPTGWPDPASGSLAGGSGWPGWPGWLAGSGRSGWLDRWCTTADFSKLR